VPNNLVDVGPRTGRGRGVIGFTSYRTAARLDTGVVIITPDITVTTVTAPARLGGSRRGSGAGSRGACTKGGDRGSRTDAIGLGRLTAGHRLGPSL
jgi:hypothetical protein